MFGLKIDKLHKAQMTGGEDGLSVLGHIASGHLGIIHRRMVLRTKTQHFHQHIPSIFMAYFTLFTIFYTLGKITKINILFIYTCHKLF